MCYNTISTAGSDFYERIFDTMTDDKNELGFIDESKLTPLEKSILFDFQQLSEDEKKSVIDFICSLLGK